MEIRLLPLLALLWRSRLGRMLFFVHLVFGLLAVGYYYQNLGTGSAIPFRGFAKLFYSLNWLTLAVFEPLFSVINAKGATHTGDSIIMLICSAGWWVYGAFAEFVAGTVRRHIEGDSGDDERREELTQLGL
jgi:hypothetical protein